MLIDIIRYTKEKQVKQLRLFLWKRNDIKRETIDLQPN